MPWPLSSKARARAPAAAAVSMSLLSLALPIPGNIIRLLRAFRVLRCVMKDTE